MPTPARFDPLLTIDGVINLLLGAALMCFPLGLPAWLVLPEAPSAFYPSLLGAVLCGIALALFIEARGSTCPKRGLGVAGAIAINLCGGLALALWLLGGSPMLPRRGQIVLWTIAVTVLLITLFEIRALAHPSDKQT